MAFRQAGRLAMSEGMPKCSPILLEPVMAVAITVPSEANARINSIISQRRGQILGFDGRDGWPGWDVITGAYSSERNGQLDRRSPLGDGRRWIVYGEVRSPGGSDRPVQGSGVVATESRGGVRSRRHVVQKRMGGHCAPHSSPSLKPLEPIRQRSQQGGSWNVCSAAVMCSSIGFGICRRD